MRRSRRGALAGAAVLMMAAAGARLRPWCSRAFSLPSSAATCELVVVRHGETDWNRALRVQGSTDIPLNERGHLQAAQCADALVQDLQGPPSAVYSSALQRAADTAAAIAVALGMPPPRRDVRLNEWDMGVIEGLRKEEAAAKHADDWSIFSQWCSPAVSASNAARRISGGESMDAVQRRAVACLEEACTAAGGGVVVAVTHGGVLGQLLRYAEGKTHAVGVGERRHAATNACISRFLVQPGGPWRVLRWACSQHLVGDAAPAAADYGGKH